MLIFHFVFSTFVSFVGDSNFRPSPRPTGYSQQSRKKAGRAHDKKPTNEKDFRNFEPGNYFDK